ncbi:MAG: DUF1203 domain-containing protein [Oricola sp.]
MTGIRFLPLDTETVRALQRGGPDAYGFKAETAISDGDRMPCRHCLSNIEAGDEYLILAHRPFPASQPFAETGPIFLHARECEAAAVGPDIPEILTHSPRFILRGYGNDDRIHYGSGKIVEQADIPSYAEELFANREIAYVHVRSATNNCYQARIERA